MHTCVHLSIKVLDNKQSYPQCGGIPVKKKRVSEHFLSEFCKMLCFLPSSDSFEWKDWIIVKKIQLAGLSIVHKMLKLYTASNPHCFGSCPIIKSLSGTVFQRELNFPSECKCSSILFSY